jgi:hypothetical protein
MIKSKGNNIGKAENMGVINQKMEKIRGKMVQRITQNTKMNEHKKRPSKGVTFMCDHR